MSLQFLSLTRTADNIARLSIQIPDNTQHTVTADFLYEFLEVLNSIQEEKLKGLIILSARKDVFLTGIEANTLDLIASQETASAQTTMGFFSLGNQCCRQLAQLNCPTVAIINGACTDVGIEISMACDYRILINSETTRLSYPAVAQGYHIGFGGLSRLIQLVGLPETLRFLTAENSYSQSQCLSTAMVDSITEDYQAEAQASYILLNPVSKKSPPLHRTLTNKLTREIGLASSQNLPITPLQQQVIDNLLDTYRTYGATVEACQQEVTTATSLLLSKTTRNALYTHRLIEEKSTKPADTDAPTQPLRIHIIGCGTMGKYLARYCALKSLLVSIHDSRHAALESVLPESHTYFQTHYPDHPQLVQQALEYIVPDTNNDGLTHADIIIEAIQENSDAKASLLLEIDKHAKSDACILTSTACLPLHELARNMQHPERLRGLNLFHPSLHQPNYPVLAEIMLPSLQDEPLPSKLQSLIHTLALITVPVKSAPGYLGTRILMAYLIEALKLHETGITITEIDTASEALGMRHAPFILMDQIGLEECLKVQEALADRLGYDVPRTLIHKVEQGMKGQSTGEGFYKYKKGLRQQPLTGLIRKQLPGKPDQQTIQKRLLEAIINESRACLNEKIVNDTKDIDLITVTMIGMSPSKGGALKYLQDTTQPQHKSDK